jgi:hypothetical protein
MADFDRQCRRMAITVCSGGSGRDWISFPGWSGVLRSIGALTSTT